MDAFSPRVLVTGGGLGIGYSIVEFLINKYNARVVVFTLQYGPEMEALYEKYSSAKRLWIYKGDVTKEDDTAQAVAIATSELGGLDTLVISAGVEPTPARIVDMRYSEFVRTMNINVCGAFLSVQKSLPLLREPSIPRPDGKNGRILILSSTADGGRYAGRSAYCSSKAALTRFIDNLANEERETGIDVYGIYPGFTRTGLADGLINQRYDHVLFPEEAEKYRKWISGGAVEGPEWCGEACAMLSVGVAEGLKGKTDWYSVHVPEMKNGKGFW